MTKRKKYFTTLREARRYVKEYKPRTVLDPEPARLEVFKYGKRYFVGTPMEFDFVRFT